MPAGDVRVQTLKIGDIDLTNFKEASYVGLNIYEDIMNPYGPAAEIRVLDHSDVLGSKNLTGSYDKDVEITLSTGGVGGSRTYKMKMFQNKNMNDQSMHFSGSGHHKQYDIRAVSPELINAQGNYIQKSFNDQTHKMVEHVVKEGFKSKAKVNIKSKTKGKRKIIFHNEHPLNALKKLNHEHVSAQDESSTFVLFQKQNNNQQEYVFATFEELFKGQSKVTLTQSATLAAGASEQQKQNAVLWFRPSDSFFTPSRPMSKGSEHTFNYTTHKVSAIDPKQTKTGNFKLIDSPIYKQQTNSSHIKQIPIHSVVDMAGNDEKHETATARVKRAAFLSYLAQQSAELEVPYNPNIHVGDIITLNIPKKATTDSEQGEKQFNGKVLVVAIRIKLKPPGQSPNCTMILRVTKGGSVKQGGNNDA